MPTFNSSEVKFKRYKSKIVSVLVVDDNYSLKEVCVSLLDSGEFIFEVYQGDNYVSGSKDKSRSWSYKKDFVPTKWRTIYLRLVGIHKNHDWSK